jgi:pimeloyl-ACP methyl ester carboxylesterase
MKQYSFDKNESRTNKKSKTGLFLIMGLVALASPFVYVASSIRSSILKKKAKIFMATNQVGHDEIDSQFKHYYVKAGGVNWHYIESGNPDGEVILLVHGLPEGFYSWSKVIPLLNQDYRIIAIDMKGYGRSTSTDTNYDWHHVGDQTLALMDALSIDKFNIVGHDWGAIISSILVGDHPDRILSFIRMEADLFAQEDTTKLYMAKPQWLLFENEWISRLILGDAKWFINTVYNHKRMTTKLSDTDRTYFTYEFSREGVSNVIGKYFLVKNRDTNALFEKISENTWSFPVVQVQADSDPAQPLALFDMIPERCQNVELIRITNAGHFSNIDQPQQVADVINQVVSR